ncbi:MAG: corrinoid protein [Limisphaerales bacterium]
MGSVDEHAALNLSGLRESIICGDAALARSITENALIRGVDPLRLVTEFMSPAMDEVGARFERSEYFVPELLLSARAMKGAMEFIRPLLAARGDQPIGRVVIGTVKGDLHDIGKNLVAAMLEGGGFEVFDLGVNVAPEKFIAAAQEREAQIIALSALLTTTMLNMRNLISALDQAGLRQKVRVLIGGAPVTAEFAREIGADGYGSNAVEAVSRARELIQQTPCTV